MPNGATQLIKSIDFMSSGVKQKHLIVQNKLKTIKNATPSSVRQSIII